jgi:hypothetical protein
MAKGKARLMPTTRKKFSKIGVWSFLIGLVVAVLAGGIIPRSNTVVLVLGGLGLIVGILNITAKEAIPFLVATIALVVAVSGMGVVLAGLTGDWAASMIKVLDNIAIFVAPAALIVALKSIYVLAAD